MVEGGTIPGMESGVILSQSKNYFALNIINI